MNLKLVERLIDEIVYSEIKCFSFGSLFYRIKIVNSEENLRRNRDYDYVGKEIGMEEMAKRLKE